ncbi:MAG TPA: OsmC family protein [Anaeromyxobacteraceae bacterium]|nr:OsmC family protein [Anaeromyxobacteraceae bacterium]
MASEIVVTLPGNMRVDTEVGGHVIRTDQPVGSGGEDGAPSPFSLFLASIGTCAGVYVAGFCRKRELPTEGLRIRQRNHFDPDSGLLARVELEVEVPPTFPEKYREALVRVADQCPVKRAIQAAPAFQVRTVVVEGSAGQR